MRIPRRPTSSTSPSLSRLLFCAAVIRDQLVARITVPSAHFVPGNQFTAFPQNQELSLQLSSLVFLLLLMNAGNQRQSTPAAEKAASQLMVECECGYSGPGNTGQETHD